MKIIKNKNTMISYLLKNISCTCFVYLLTMANAHALPQKKDINKKTKKLEVLLSFVPEKDTTGKNKESIKEGIATSQIIQNIISEQTPPLNLALEITSTKHIDFDKLKPKSKIRQIKEQYLTFYSGKKEKLKATYLQGAYAINYTQSW